VSDLLEQIAGLRILIIDDEEDIRTLIKEYLSEFTCITYDAHDGKSALDLLDKKGIDLALIDLQLPDTNGLDLTAKIQSLWPHVKVILVTGQADRQSLAKALMLGVHDFIEKPFTGEVMKNRVLNSLSSIHQQKLIKEVVLEFLAANCNNIDKNAFFKMPAEKQNQLIEMGLTLFRIKKSKAMIAG